MTETTTDCIEWHLKPNKDGYGIKNIAGKQYLAHRLVYEQMVGPIPDGLSILHSCDNRMCVNPDHLRAGTHQENMQDMLDRNRTRNQYKLATQCVRGHQFDATNTYINPTSGSRQCRICRREDNRRRKKLS